MFAVAFAGSPTKQIPFEFENASGDILWEELVAKQLHSIFWNQTGSDLAPLICWGPKGVQAFVDYTAYFVVSIELTSMSKLVEWLKL